MQPRYLIVQVKWGAGGKLVILLPPGGFTPLSTRESGFQGAWHMNAPAVRALVNDPSTRESGLFHEPIVSCFLRFLLTDQRLPFRGAFFDDS